MSDSALSNPEKWRDGRIVFNAFDRNQHERPERFNPSKYGLKYMQFEKDSALIANAAIRKMLATTQ